MHRRNTSCDRYKGVKEWIEQMGCPARRLSREFADCVTLAVILKRIFPRLVDLPLYLPCTKLDEKIQNYELLNNKVLSRIGCPMDRDTIHKIAKGEPGAIEEYLYRLIPETKKVAEEVKIVQKKNSLDSLDEYFDDTNSDFLTVEVEKNCDGEITVVPQKMVSLKLYDTLRRDDKQKSEHIHNLKLEIERLRNLLEGAKNAMSSLFDANINPKMYEEKE